MLTADENLLISNRDTISHHNTDRNDVPPPPLTPWSTLDTTKLNFCERELWWYIGNIYPIDEEYDNGYQMYGLKGEPADEFGNRQFISDYIRFFTRTFWQQYLLSKTRSCRENFDTTFFQQAIGEPTCKVLNKRDNQVTYFYNLKLRYRHGPCPYTRVKGVEYAPNFTCYALHFQYCAMFRVIFSQEDGKLDYIDFAGSG